jgi:hypothetical protein
MIMTLRGLAIHGHRDGDGCRRAGPAPRQPEQESGQRQPCAQLAAHALGVDSVEAEADALLDGRGAEERAEQGWGAGVVLEPQHRALHQMAVRVGRAGPAEQSPQASGARAPHTNVARDHAGRAGAEHSEERGRLEDPVAEDGGHHGLHRAIAPVDRDDVDLVPSKILQRGGDVRRGLDVVPPHLGMRVEHPAYRAGTAAVAAAARVVEEPDPQ